MSLKKYIFQAKLRYLLKATDEFENLKKVENLSVKQLKELNFKKRVDIVNNAYQHSPFYKAFYDTCNFNPITLLNESDWSNVPVITKQLIKENTQSIVNPNFKISDLRSSSTGGSTGEPLKVFFDKKTPLEQFGWRTLNWWGIEPWENQAYIYRNVRKGLGKIINTIKWWPTKRVLLDCSSMDVQDMDCFIAKINKIKPAFIQGYVGGVYDFAKYVNDNHIKLFAPKAIWVTAAPLSESTRLFIESALGAPVYDQYGCSEMFWLAAECKNKKGLHVLSDIRHIEFLDNNNNIVENGDFGDVVITDLENIAFPLIRYKNGDSGRYLKNNCSCNLPYPLIDKIKGRVSDNIYTPSGINVNGAYLTTIFDRFPDLIESFQIIQKKDYSVVINCILSKDISVNDGRFNKIKKELLLKTKKEIKIEFQFLDSLVQDRGKLKFVISELEKVCD